MRTDRFLAQVCMVAAASCASAPYGLAADVEFNPTVDFNVFYDGNTRGVGEDAPPPQEPPPDPPTDPTSTDDPSAIVGGIGVTLPWTVRTPSTTFAVSYRPRREIYGDEERPDFTSHALETSVGRTVSPRASYSVAARYDRTDRQELDPRRPPDELVDPRTYTLRRTFESGGLSGSGSFSAGRSSSLDWRVGVRWERGEDLPESPYQDSEAYNAGFGWAHDYSPQGSAGIGLLVQHFTYEASETFPDVDVVSLGHTGTRRFSRDGSLIYAVGALRSDNGGVTNTAGSVNVTANWVLGPRSSITAGVRQGASAGDGTSGATLDRGGYASWSYTAPRGFSASVAATYWDRRNLNDPSAASALPAAFTFSDALSWRVGRFFRIGVFHTFHSQSSDEAALETNYHSAGLHGSWIVRGERRAGA
ncbi:MAG TPA: hypothetical protein VF139_05660 [Candidatus Polarisedimenticolaceae bacterium]